LSAGTSSGMPCTDGGRSTSALVTRGSRSEPSAGHSCPYFFPVGFVGPVGVPPDPADVLAPGAGGLVGPVEVPPGPPLLLRPKPGEVFPAAPGTPAGAPTAPPPVPTPPCCANVAVALPATSSVAAKAISNVLAIEQFFHLPADYNEAPVPIVPADVITLSFVRPAVRAHRARVATSSRARAANQRAGSAQNIAFASNDPFRPDLGVSH
jgi:hypothetical protein